MDIRRRQLALSALLLPAGCTIQYLPPLQREPIDGPAKPARVRPPALGQRWTYQKFNVYNSQVLATETEDVVSLYPHVVIRRQNDAGQILPEEHQHPWGQLLRDPIWDFPQNYESPVAHWPASLEPQTRQATQTHYRLDQFSFRLWISALVTVRNWERVRLASGSFDALRIDKFIRFQHYETSRIDCVRTDVIWFVPEIGRWVARETKGEYRTSGGRNFVTLREDHFRWELTAWS